MSRFEYAKLFFLGKKSIHMKSIEYRFPKLGKFKRGEAFFHAFGNLHLYHKHGTFLMLLPANQDMIWQNTKCDFILNCKLFAFYTQHREKDVIQKSANSN